MKSLIEGWVLREPREMAIKYKNSVGYWGQ